MSRLIRNATVLMSGSVVSQLIPILLSPILSRIFNENDFAIYALFGATINIISQFICLKYDMAIAVVKDDDEAVGLFYGSVIISAFVSTIVALVILFWQGDKWVYFVPICAFLTGLYSAVLNLNIRLGHFKDISSGNIVKSVTMIAGQIVFMLMGFGGVALIIGQVLAYLFGNIRLIKNIREYFKPYKLSKIAEILSINRSYPMYTMWGSMAGALVYNLTSYLLVYFYSEAQLGYYSFINRMFAVPLTIIGTSVGQAFLKEATGDKKEQSRAFSFVSRALFLLAIPMASVLFIFAEPIIGIIFGESWLPCAVYLRLLLPLFVTRFIVTPISTTAIVMGKQAYTMLWQMSLLMLSIIPAILALIYGIGIEEYLLIFSVLLSFGYLGFYVLCRKMIIDREKKSE